MKDLTTLKLEYDILLQKHAALRVKFKKEKKRSAIRSMTIGHHRTVQPAQMELFLSNSYKYDALGKDVIIVNCQAQVQVNVRVRSSSENSISKDLDLSYTINFKGPRRTDGLTS